MFVVTSLCAHDYVIINNETFLIKKNYDIETYGKYLKKQKKKLQNTTHEQLLKPYLIGYTLKNNYDDKFSKKCQIFTGDQCVEKCLLNLIFTERPYINKIIDENFNKPIEHHPDLLKFNINICHLCNEKIDDNPVRNHCHFSGEILHNHFTLYYSLILIQGLQSFMHNTETSTQRNMIDFYQGYQVR